MHDSSASRRLRPARRRHARLGVPAALLAAATLGAGAASNDVTTPASAPRPITLADGMKWKNIGSPTLSPDGTWLAYRYGAEFAPGEVVVHATGNDVEIRLTGGEPPRAVVGSGRFAERPPSFSFSKDSRYLAWTVFPEHDPAAGKPPAPDAAADPAAADRGRKAKLRKLGILELQTNEQVVLESVASYAFAGDRADWIAILKAGDDRPRGGRKGGDDAKDEHPGPGADLLLRELATGKTMAIGHVTEYAFDESGRFLAWAAHPDDETGAGVSVRDLETGVVRILASGGKHYKSLRWLEHGDAVAFLEGRHDDAWKEDLYTLWGFSGFAAGEPLEVHWDPATEPAFPAAMGLHPSQSPYWLEDRSAFVFGLRKLDAKDGADQEPDAKATADVAAAGEAETKPEAAEAGKSKEADKKDKPPHAGLVIWHWRDDRLPTQQRVEEQRDRDRSFLAVLQVADRKFVRLATDDLPEVTLGEDDRFAIGVDRRHYELDGSIDGRRYQDVWGIDPKSGERFQVAEKLRWFFGGNPQGDHLLYYRDRAFWSYDLATRAAHNLTSTLPTTFVDQESDVNVVDPPVPPPGWSEDGKAVLLADNWDLWKVPVAADGAATRITTDGKDRGIRYRRAFQLDPEDEGYDLSDPLYISAYGERTKKGGLARLRPDAEHAELLLWEDAAFNRLIKAEKAPILAFSKETPLEYPDLWVTDADLQAGKRLTEGGKQRDGLEWTSGRMLIDYKCAKGEALQASLQLPANYEKGRRYPTVVYIYERMSPMHNRFYPPEQSGFSAAAFTSNGYAVLMPDIKYHIDDPGMSAAWCVLPALDAAVRSGVVDAEHVGLHGHSWGGYQTAFLVTQTNKFRAAVAGAPLTDLVSMYSSIYWNAGFANQPLFESSQGRFSGDFLDQPDAYLRNSPVFQARKIETPLMILHNDKDGAVDFNQGIELFNILRRLHKPVVMLQYEGENHGLVNAENQRDYAVRLREFFDHHLKGAPAPPWLADGIKRLDLERHLEDRAREIVEAAAEPAPAAGASTPAAPGAPAESAAPPTEPATPPPAPKIETSSG